MSLLPAAFASPCRDLDEPDCAGVGTIRKTKETSGAHQQGHSLHDPGGLCSKANACPKYCLARGPQFGGRAKQEENPLTLTLSPQSRGEGTAPIAWDANQNRLDVGILHVRILCKQRSHLKLSDLQWTSGLTTLKRSVEES